MAGGGIIRAEPDGKKIRRAPTPDEERIFEEMDRIMSRMSTEEFQKFLETEEYIMPNDQNYLWSDGDKPQDSKFCDFKKIPAIKFSDPRVKLLKPDNIEKYFLFQNIEEAGLEAEYGMAFLIYKYTQIFKEVPSWIYLTNEVLKKNFFEKFINEMNLPPESFIATYRFDNKKTDIGNFWCSLGRLLLFFDGNGTYIIFPKGLKDFEKKENEMGILLGLAKTYKTPPVVKNKIYIVFKSDNGFEKKSFTVKKIKNINIDENYNEGFGEVSKEIISKLNNKKKTGLVILHGETGTGKTTFIRYLAGKLNRNIIFISPDMVHHITEPDFIPFLMDNPDAILIMEDAEDAVQKRGMGRGGAVSNILNLTDGLLSDCLNISIVVTFNTETKNIDEALLRKGRLLKAYKFDKLSIPKVKTLFQKNGDNPDSVTKAMSLAEIYFNKDEVKGNDGAFAETTKVGFKTPN